MLITDLIPKVRSILGDEDSTNYLFTDNVYRDTKIPSGIDRFNLEFPTQFIITGTAGTATISPTPSADEATLICLYSVLVSLEGEISRKAQMAVVITDPAGRTDATKVVVELREQRKSIRTDLNKALERANIFGTSGESESSQDSL